MPASLARFMSKTKYIIFVWISGATTHVPNTHHLNVGILCVSVCVCKHRIIHPAQSDKRVRYMSIDILTMNIPRNGFV